MLAISPVIWRSTSSIWPLSRWLEGAQLLLVVGHERGALLAQALNQRVGDGLRHAESVADRGLGPGRLGLDPRILRGRQRRVEVAQVLRRQRGLVLADRDDLLGGGELHQLTFRILEPALELGQAFLEILSREAGRVEAPLQVAGDEGIGPCVGDARGQLRIG